MLYIHCGWPRTSTSSLQIALAENREPLATIGLAYPKPSTRPSAAAHDELYAVLDVMHRSGRIPAEFRRLSESSGDQDVLLSAEGISNWIPDAARRTALTTLLSEIEKTTPTTCIWTLRRIDEAAASLYLLGLWAGIDMPPPVEAITRWDYPNNPFGVRRLDGLFGGMRQLADRDEGKVVFLKYDRAGAHNIALLRAVGVADPPGAEIRRALDRGPRRNVRVSHKQAVALLHLDQLSTQTGVALDRVVLKQAIASGQLQFEEDHGCEPIDVDTKRDLHRRALEAAHRQGFSAYPRFFGEDEISGPPKVELGVEALTDRDLKRLVTTFETSR